MDSVFGSEKLNRQRVLVNNRTSIRQEFNYVPNFSPKSVAEPRTLSWANRGKGVQGESVNSQNVSSKFVIRKPGKAL